MLVASLAAGQTVLDAAREAGLSEKTAHRRLAEPEFRRRVAAARDQMLARAVGQLTDAATEAVATLRELLAADALAVRLGAARSILDLGRRLREALELDARLTELEGRLSADDNPKGNNHASIDKSTSGVSGGSGSHLFG